MWVGRDYPATYLNKEFDSVILCGGSTQARDLPVPGRNLIRMEINMADQRLNKLAKLLVNYSTEVKEGDFVFICAELSIQLMQMHKKRV